MLKKETDKKSRRKAIAALGAAVVTGIINPFHK